MIKNKINKMLSFDDLIRFIKKCYKWLITILNPRCPSCGSRDNKIEYYLHRYFNSKSCSKMISCNNCRHFWYTDYKL